MQRIPHPNVLVGNIYVAQGQNGKIWLIMDKDPEGKLTGEGLEPDEAAQTELRDFLDKFFRKHIADAPYAEGAGR